MNEDKQAEAWDKSVNVSSETEVARSPPEHPQKSRWERSWPVIACGAGLSSDGYLASVIV